MHNATVVVKTIGKTYDEQQIPNSNNKMPVQVNIHA